MHNKKGLELPINTVIIIILALITLVVLLLIFSSSMRQVVGDLMTKIKGAFGFWNATQVSP